MYELPGGWGRVIYGEKKSNVGRVQFQLRVRCIFSEDSKPVIGIFGDCDTQAVLFIVARAIALLLIENTQNATTH